MHCKGSTAKQAGVITVMQPGRLVQLRCVKELERAKQPYGVSPPVCCTLYTLKHLHNVMSTLSPDVSEFRFLM